MEVKPVIEFRDDILKLHIAYLEKVEVLTDRERGAFCDYFNHISRPMMMVTKDVNLYDVSI